MVKVKVHDKIKAIQALNKMLGFDMQEQTDPFGDLTFKISQKT